MPATEVTLNDRDSEFVDGLVGDNRFKSRSQVVEAALVLLRAEIAENGYLFVAPASDESS